MDLLASWTSLVGSSDSAQRTWTDLVTRWSEPHRSYHGMAHLYAVLALVGEYADAAEDPRAVALAAWFHDAVYDPTAADNEECSAALAEAELTALGVAPDSVAEVARLVRVTATHAYADGDRNAALLCSADLAILAAPPTAYSGYANAIRAEYSHVADSDFRRGRAAVLRGLLDQPLLFGVPAMAASLEEAARANLRAELLLLTDGAWAGAAPPPAGV